MTKRLPYGSWPSPLTAEQIAAGTVPVGGGAFVGDELWWLEGRPAEGGRLTVVAGDPVRRLVPRELVPAPFNVRSRVNEYGGASWAVVPEADGTRLQLVFSNFADQRAYLLDPTGDGRPVPLTPESGADPQLRFAEFTASPLPCEVLAQCEDHRGAEPERYIVAIPLDGSAADDAGRLRRVTPSYRFVGYPRVSPDGTRIAWISWDHPRMPWDGTLLHVADLSGGVAAEPLTLAGGDAESVLQPEWLDARTLAYASDRSGWWNLYAQEVEGEGGKPSSASARALCPRDEEFAGPLWQVGTTWFKVLGPDSLLVTHGTHGMVPAVLDLATGLLRDLEVPFTKVSPSMVRGHQLLATASSLTEGDGLRLIDLGPALGGPAKARAAGPAGSARPNAGDGMPGGYLNIRLSLEERPDEVLLPTLRPMEFTNAHGETVHANVYEPRLDGYAGETGELPPFVAFVHGGPTSQAGTTLNLGIAYYTSRGIGVVDVNYGGSTGFGRAYRERLKGQWGVVDVADTVAVMEGLVAAGLADPERLAIEGGSAGGWTTLACLTRTATFSAGISRYGVADLEALVADTHDFESRYMEGLVGPWPEARELYRDRAPVNHVDGLDCPVLLLQGDEDKVVPPAQSQVFADALAAKGIPHAYVLFAGEQHGFRRAENITRAHELGLAFYAKVFGFSADVPNIELV